MMQNLGNNPDGRPLPNGWSQHFEPSKRMWYYVQMNVMPPKVSFTHPADLSGSGGGSSTPSQSRSSNALQQNFMERPQSMTFPPMPGFDSSRSGGLTFAQKLYASSASNTHAVPMLNPTDIHQNASKPHLPSPPSSSRGTSPLPISPADFHPAGIPRHNASRMSSMPNFRVSEMLPIAGSDTGGPMHTHHHPHHHPTRSTTFAAAQAFGQPNRIVTQQARPGFAPPRQTPHILTTARPPSESSTNAAHPVLNHAGGPPRPSLSNSTAGSAPSALGGTASPPPTSVLFAKPQPPLPPPPPPPPLLSMQQSYGSMSPPAQINSPTSTISTITPDNAHLHRPSATGIQGNIMSMANTYNPPEPSPLSGGGPTFDSRLIPSLRFALSRAGGRVSESDIQGVIQGDVNANYQGVVNALKQQQLGYQLQNEGFQIDYAGLLVETQRLQIRAQAQQAESLLAQQSNLQAQAYAQLSASLQAQQEAQAQALAERLQQEELARLQQQQQMASIQQQAQQALQAQQQQQQQLVAQQQQALAAQQQQNQQLLAQQQQQEQALAQQQQQMAAAQQQQQQQTIAQQQQALAQQQQQLAAQQQQQQQLLAQQQQQAAAQQQQQLAQQQAMYDSLLQQQQQQQQQQQPQQQQQQGGPLNTFLDIYNQFQQQQQTTATDTANQAPPSFDALYGSGDPTGGASSFMESFTQTVSSTTTGLLSGGGGDPSGGITGFFSGLNTTIANTDVSALGSTFDMGSLGDSLGAFASE